MKLSLVAAFVVGVVLIFNVFPSPTEALPADVQMWGVGEVIIWLQDEGFGEDVIQVFHRNDIDGRKLLLLSVEDMQEMKLSRANAKLIVTLINKFASRRMIDVDGRICVRTQWYWRLFSVLLVFPLMIILVLPLSLITSLLIPANLFGAYRPVLIKTIETAFGWGVNIFWFYLLPGQDLAYWLVNLYTVDSHGHLASFGTSLVRTMIEVTPATLMPSPAKGYYFLLNLAIWFLIGDPIPDLVMGTTVCAFS